MKISAEKIVLTAKQHKIEELNRLGSSTVFVEAISNLIHSLQAERGASSLYLASVGKRFEQNKHDIIKESQILEIRFRELLAKQLAESSYANTKLLSLMAWVLLGLEDLTLLRKSIHIFELSAIECIQAYSRLISGLISLIFNLADTVIDPRISNLLVALFNLVQGKELAGQERGVGSIAFASGSIETDHLQRIVHLIENQQRLFEVFCDLAEASFIEKWKVIKTSP
ncbi:MAG: nitrate- and nitrite sensing domain-containing protein, partial [Methylophilus sp.]